MDPVGEASDVICFLNEETGELTSTDFYALFRFSVLRNGALSILGLNPTSNWVVSSQTFHVTGEKDDDGIGAGVTANKEHEASRLGDVHLYSNGSLCRDIRINISQSDKGVVRFRL